MKRPGLYIMLFTACVLLCGAALAWLSLHTVRAEQDRAKAIADAERQERLRQALWRVDFAASGLISKETARPPEHIKTVSPVWNAWGNGYGKENFCSPLWGTETPGVRLHFELDTNSQFSCTEVPEGSAEAATARFNTLNNTAQTKAAFAQLKQMPAENRAQLHSFANQQSFFPVAAPSGPTLNQEVVVQSRNSALQWQQDQINQVDQSKRKAVYSNNVSNSQSEAAGTAAVQKISAYAGKWIDGELYLLRVVKTGEASVTQGVWLDWPKLRAEWKTLIDDILPAAEFTPVAFLPEQDTGLDANLMQSLPIRILPGKLTFSTEQSPPGTSQMLLACWVAFGLAAVAMGLLYFRSLALSERRAAFVSAVTHELRTPLTTFRLYTEMLVTEMVPEGPQRRGYLETLHQEAGRLNHLVENVLSFARLEKGSARSRLETASVSEHLDRMLPRLSQRADLAAKKLVCQIHQTAQNTVWQVDVTALEQILMNLMDNAAKYAHGTDPEVEIAVQVQSAWVEIEFRDHGPGIPKATRKHLFKPFHKSADDAAQSAPGIGLGLSLSRRLARELGGDLECLPASSSGCTFRLKLPSASPTKPE